MIFSVWHHVNDELPDTSGWYYAFKDISMGDDSEEVGMYFYDIHREQFYEHVSGVWVNVQFWTKVSFDFFKHKEMNPAEKIAADNVLKAIENYNLIAGLSQ